MANVMNIKKGKTNGQGYMQHDAVPCNDATFPIAQGDLVYWDSAAKICKKLVASDANAANILGVALKASKVNSSIDASTEPNVTVGFGCIAELKTTAAQTYNHGDLVYSGADEQTVTTTAGTNPVGVVQLVSKGSAITGAAGVLVQVLVYSKAFVKFSN